MNEPLVCIVVLHWFNEADTMACMRAVRGLLYDNFFTVIVDNGSDPATRARLSAAGTGWDYIGNPVNLGYAGGCNVGIAHAKARGAEYVWLLNSDAIVTADVLGKLVATAEADRSIGLVAPLMRSDAADTELNLLCGRFDRRLLTLHYVFTLDDVAALERDKPDEIVLMGAALLARTAMLQAVGGFDEKLFAYWEDIDLSLRCVAAGYRVRLDKTAWVFHPRKDFFDPAHPVKPHVYYYLARNEIITVRKFGKGRAVWRSLLWGFLRQMDFVARTPDNIAGCHALLAGLWDGWRGRCGPWQPRRSMPAPLRRLLLRHPLLPRKLMSKPS
jgi:GT2 family glycosyltransferase